MSMQRLTISVNKSLAQSFDELITRKGYRNRSEAFRDLLRRALKQEAANTLSAAYCMACVSFVCDTSQRILANRLIELRKRHPGIAISSTHVPIDGSTSFETLILRGEAKAVIKLADAVVAETGVEYGQINLVPIEMDLEGTI